MKKLIGIFLVLLVFQGISLGAGTAGGWADLWNSFSYNESNFESRNFRSALLRTEGRFGVYALDLWGKTRFMPYLAYVGVAAGNPSPWNNTIAGGVGFRFYPFAARGTGWIKEIKLYAETLSLSYLKNRQSKPTADTRFGLDLWYEWNQAQKREKAEPVNYGRPWGETWANISYRRTNFEKTDFNSILVNIQLKNGLYFGGGRAMLFEPYLRTDLVMSGQKDFWLNNFVYGLGIRVQPFRSRKNSFPLLYKLKVFLEVLRVTYFNQQPADGRPGSDFRFGLDLSLGR